MKRRTKKLVAALMLILILLNNSLNVYASVDSIEISEDIAASVQEDVSNETAAPVQEPSVPTEEPPAQEPQTVEEAPVGGEQATIQTEEVEPTSEVVAPETSTNENNSEVVTPEPEAVQDDNTQEASEPVVNAETVDVNQNELAVEDDIKVVEPEEDLATLMPAQDFKETVGNIHVSVHAEEETFYKGTYMKVEPVETLNIIDSLEETINESVASVVAVNITFYNENNEEVEPQKEVSVSITSDAITEMKESVVVHVEDSGEAAIVDKSSETDNNVSFDAKTFSIYAVVGTETISTLYNASNGNTYEVTVTYGPEAKIPYGSKLQVTEFADNSNEYANARKAVLADKKARGEEIDYSSLGLSALDISILDKDGIEIEPEAPVKVDLKIKALPGVNDLSEVSDSIGIQHHVETGNGIVIDRVNYDKNMSTNAVMSTFNVETNDKVISTGIAVDPNSVNEEEFNKDNQIEENQVDVSFEVEVFSTFTITWRTGYYDYARTVTVHYVDTNGNELTISNPNNTHTNLNAQSSSPAFLIYDIEGYTYSYTYRNTNTNRIAPILSKNNNNYWRYTGTDNVNWTEMSNNDNIYVVYTKDAEPTSGGTPSTDVDETWPAGDDAPQFGKSSTNNGNGTNTISLSIEAGEKPVAKSTPADVIVIFDVSGSMGGNNIWRLNTAKTAVNNMAKTLLNGDNNGVRMALISFSTTAQQVNISGATNGFTSNYANFSSAVNGLSASGGTNWEQALKLANEMNVRSDAATFVVFVTDGDPTFRVSRGNVTNRDLADDTNNDTTYQYYRNNHVFGEGYADSNGYNFDYAVDQVKAIAGKNKNFYAIGISNDVTKVQNLTTEGGVAANHAFIASDSTAMEAAFKSITENIKSTLGFGDVEITDGITALTNAEMKVMQNVDPASFKYYRYGGENNKYGADYDHKQEWTTREADGCAAASYSKTDGAVHWDMGETFQLEDDVTYVVEFIVWPSQAAYDLVADLNNGLKTYASLSEAEKAQVVELEAPTATTTGRYALKTNTDKVNATYNKTTKSGDTVTISDQTDITATYHEGRLDNMSLTSDYITVKKEWHNALDTRVESGITLTVTKDGAVYLDNVSLNPDNSWTSGKEYISAGFITKTADGRYNVREKGHDYTVTEPASFSYYWDLTADVYRPMVIDGELNMLIKTDSPTGTEGTDYFVIDGKSYQVSSETHPQLVAQNDRRSNLNLKKLVTANTQAIDKVPDSDDVFTYTITVTDVNGDNVWFSAQDESGATVTIESYSSNVTPEIRDEQPTGSYSVPSGAQFTISIKAGWNLRFFNLPTGTTYIIQETGMVDGYEFVKAETSAEVTAPEYADKYKATPGAVSGNTVTGTIDQPNNVYSTEYTNNWNPNNEIVIIKVDENGARLADAQFKLSKLTADGWKEIATFTSIADAGEAIKVGHGLYKLEETTAPTGYGKTEIVYFEVVTSGNTTTVSLTDETGEEKTYLDASARGNEVTIKNLPLATAYATKAWKNADGTTTAPEGAKVTYTLYADGSVTEYTVELDGTADTAPTGTAGYEDAAWSAKFVNLPKYKMQNNEKVEIVYTIAETSGYPGYKASTEDPVASGSTITNTQEATLANATKAWKNADGTTSAPTGATVTYTLYADGTATSYTVTLDGTKDETVPTTTGGYESEAWKAEFINLPKYKVVEGKAVEIVYTVAETSGYPGYKASTEDSLASGSTITNTQEATLANATKAWKNADGTTSAPTGATVTYTLYADGTATSYTVTLDGTKDETVPTTTGGYESEVWKAEFINLPKYKVVEGKAVEIVYTVAETSGYPGYKASTEDPVASGSTITNTQEATLANATKAWKNADGTTSAPTGATVTYTLYADGTATSYTVTLDGTKDETVPTTTGGYESESWKASFVNLPKYKVGTTTEIVYTVAETTTYPGYTPDSAVPVASGSTITNEQEKANIVDATKAWKNADGTTGAPTGATVTYTLYADGTATSYTVTLDGTADTAPTGTAGYESEAWKATFVNLPKYKDGTTTEIVYTVAETTTYPGYTPSTTDPVVSGKTITNNQDKANIVDASKAWKNADGTTTAPEGAKVTYTLYADETATSYTVTLDGTKDETVPTTTGGYESEAWKAAFVNLPKYKVGTTTEIVYTVAETTTYPGYKASTEDPVASGSTITNIQDITEIKVTKEWNNIDGSTTAPEGATAVFTLYKNGDKTDYTVTLDGIADTAPTTTGGFEDEAWSAKFINLPKIDSSTGKDIEYKVKEVTGFTGYKASNEDLVADGGKIINTQEPTNISVTKEWNNIDGSTIAPEGATVVYTLYKNGEATEYTVTLDGTADEAPAGTAGYESEAWVATFENLPQYDYSKDGATKITYTVAETSGYAGYKASNEDLVADGGKIINTQEPTAISVTKEWINIDETNTAPKGASVEFTLYKNNEPTEYTVTLDGTADDEITTTGGYESEAWVATFKNLPQYDYSKDGATKISYTVAETKGYIGYTLMDEEQVADGETITNIQEATEASIIKVWDDADNQDGKRPEELTVTLSNGMEVVLNEENKWSATIDNLPKYDKETEIEYSWSEEMPEGYKLESIEKDGTITTITNTHIPSRISITVTKEWDDLDNKFGFRTDSITVRLKANGKEVKTARIIGIGNNWKYTFSNLEEYSNGEKIKYTITEDAVPYYTTTIVDNGNNTFKITNKIIPMGGSENEPPTQGGTVILQSANPATRSKDYTLIYDTMIATAIIAIAIVTKNERDRDKRIRILNSTRIKFK